MNFDLIAPIVAAVAGSQVLVTVVQGYFNKRKTSADAASILLDKTLEWSSKLTARIERLETELAARDALIAELRVRVLRIETNGHES